MIQQFKTAYAMHIWLKCLTWLGLISVATLLLRISDGFPPQVWYLLAQAAPAQKVLLKAAHLIDGRADAAKDGLAVLVEGDRIQKVGPAAELAAQPRAAQ